MKNYKALLFDINGTLCDYWRARDLALEKAIFDFWLEYIGDTIENNNLNSHINFIKMAEEKLRNQNYPLSELRNKRFEMWIKEFIPMEFSVSKLEKCVIDINKKYTKFTDALLEPYPDVLPALRKLYDKGFTIIAISNGPSRNQIRRLRKMNLIDYFTKLYFSEDIGFSKPDKHFYDSVFSSLGIRKDLCLAIGDDLIDDIQGAINYGIDAVWVNRKKNRNYFNKEDHPFSEVNTLEELCSLLKIKDKEIYS